MTNGSFGPFVNEGNFSFTQFTIYCNDAPSRNSVYKKLFF